MLSSEHIEAERLLEQSLILPPEIKLTLDAPLLQEDAFSIKTVAQTLSDHARSIILILMIFFVLSAAGAFLFDRLTRTHTGYSRALITLGFPEAESGLDPLGQPLNVSHAIQSPYVIGRALDELGLRERGITPEDIRANLYIASITPHGELDRIMLIRESVELSPERLMYLEDVNFHPTQFLLRLNRGRGLEDLSNHELSQVVDEIVYRYAEHFVDVYSEFRFLDVVVGHFDPLEYDFFEVVSILRGTINNMLSYTSAMRYAAPDFRSPYTQMTFGDIWANLDMLRTVDIQRISSLVYVNNMSRNRIRTANLIEYRITHLERELAIARANADDALFIATEVYEHEIWVYHQHMYHYFTYHRSSNVYVQLIQDLMNFRYRANRLEEDIAFYSERLYALRSADRPADPNDVAFVEAAIPTLFSALHEWEDIINRTVEDFLTLDLYRDAIRLILPGTFSNSFFGDGQRVILMVAAGSFMGLFLGIFRALVRDAIDERPNYKPKCGKR